MKNYITKTDVININKMLGEDGIVREMGTLEHACQDMKRLPEMIATDHPFVDRNKRTAFVVATMIEKGETADRIIRENKRWLKILGRV